MSLPWGTVPSYPPPTTHTPALCSTAPFILSLVCTAVCCALVSGCLLADGCFPSLQFQFHKDWGLLTSKIGFRAQTKHMLWTRTCSREYREKKGF
jgi:hypothetical protein